MAEGTHAQHHLHAAVAADLQEPAQVAVAAPVDLSFLHLVVAPEDVAGSDVDAAGLHLEDLPLPVPLGNAAEMDLAHDRQDVCSVQENAGAIDIQGLPVGRDGGAETEGLPGAQGSGGRQPQHRDTQDVDQ